MEDKFPNATIEICLFHVLKAVKSKVNSMNMNKQAKQCCKEWMQTLCYSWNKTDFNKNYDKMKQDKNINNNFLKYFNENWFNIKKMWVQAYRNQHFNIADTTNNRLESLNQKLKQIIAKNSPIHQFYNNLKLFLRHSEIVLNFKKFQAKYKKSFYLKDDNLNTVISMYKIHLTEFAVMKIAKHLYNAFHLKYKCTQKTYLFEIQFEKHSLASANEYN